MSNKVNLKNPKNENFEVYSSMVQSALSKSASNLFKDKYFYEEFKGVYFLANSLKIVSSLVSICTTILALHIATQFFWGYYPSMFFAVSVGICIEGIKTFLWRINSKWILKYKEVSKIMLSVLILLHCISLGFSAYGGWMLPTLMEESKLEMPVLIENDSSLTELYSSLEMLNQEIAANSLEVAKTTSNSTKRSLSTTLTLLLSQRSAKESEIAKLKESREQEKERILNEQKVQEKEFNQEKEQRILTAQISCLFASVFFEVSFVIFACFCVYYLFRVDIDENEENKIFSTLENSGLPVVKAAKLPSRQQGGKAPVLDAEKKAAKPLPIGFFNRHVDSKKESVFKCALEACNSTFEKKAHNQKYCSENCRKLDYQNRLYSKNQMSSNSYYACSVAHTKKNSDFLYFLESQELDFEGRYQITENPKGAEKFDRDKTTRHWLYLDIHAVESLMVNGCITNNEENLNSLGLGWKGYNLVKISKPSKS